MNLPWVISLAAIAAIFSTFCVPLIELGKNMAKTSADVDKILARIKSLTEHKGNDLFYALLISEDISEAYSAVE